MNSPAKSQIYFSLFVWLLAGLVMFGFVFKKLGASNWAALDQVMSLKKEQALLDAEKRSFEQAKSDLEKLKLQAVQPENFFSRDITLVNEIRRLEGIAEDLGIEMVISGVAGTVKSLQRAGTKAEIYRIPFTIQAQGTLQTTVAFMEYLENLEFLTSVNTVNLSSTGGGEVNATFNAFFYLKK